MSNSKKLAETGRATLEASLPKWRQDLSQLRQILDNLQTQSTKLKALNQLTPSDLLGQSINKVKDLIKHTEDTIDRILGALQKMNK